MFGFVGKEHFQTAPGIRYMSVSETNIYIYIYVCVKRNVSAFVTYENSTVIGIVSQDVGSEEPMLANAGESVVTTSAIYI